MKKSILVLLILAILLCPTLISARTVNDLGDDPIFISGQITAEDGQPIFGANVRASTAINKETKSYDATTDRLGRFIFKDLPQAAVGYTVIASCQGYSASGRKVYTSTDSLNLILREKELISVKSPVLFMSAGQSGGVYTSNALCERAGVPYDWSDAPVVKHLESGVRLTSYNPKTDLPIQYTKNSNFKDKEPYKTIVIVMGATLKGMCSYVSMSYEIKRSQDIIKWAKQNNVTIIGMHLEGTSLRGKPGSDNEMIIDAIAPHCDMLITIAASNLDDKFTNIAKDNNIPLFVAAKTIDLIPIFAEVFESNPQ